MRRYIVLVVYCTLLSGGSFKFVNNKLYTILHPFNTSGAIPIQSNAKLLPRTTYLVLPPTTHVQEVERKKQEVDRRRKRAGRQAGWLRCKSLHYTPLDSGDRLVRHMHTQGDITTAKLKWRLSLELK